MFRQISNVYIMPDDNYLYVQLIRFTQYNNKLDNLFLIYCVGVENLWGEMTDNPWSRYFHGKGGGGPWESKA